MRRIGMAVLGLGLVTIPLFGQRSALREVRDRGAFGADLVVADHVLRAAAVTDEAHRPDNLQE